MSDKMYDGIRVKTVKPARISGDWTPEGAAKRQWGVEGTIIGKSDSHGLIYEVRHDDKRKTTAFYEPRELQLVE